MVTRIEKIDTIEQVIERCSNAGLPAIKHEVYVFCSDRWGSEWRKFVEYLDFLVHKGLIVVEGEECWSRKRWEKIKKAREKDYLKMQDLIYG